MPIDIFSWRLEFDGTTSYSYLSLEGDIEIPITCGSMLVHRRYELKKLYLNQMKAMTHDGIELKLIDSPDSEIDYFWIEAALEEDSLITQIIGHIPARAENWSITNSKDSFLLLESETFDLMATKKPGFIGYRVNSHHGSAREENIKVPLHKIDLTKMLAYTYRVYSSDYSREIEIPLGKMKSKSNIDSIRSLKTQTEIIS